MSTFDPGLSWTSRIAFYLNCLLLVILLSISLTTCDQYSKKMQATANKFGTHMFNLGSEETCFAKMSENFQKHRSEIKQIDPTKLMEDMRKDMIHMLKMKKEAVERIALESERLASEHIFDKEIQYVDYYNMKRIYDERYENINEKDKARYNYKAIPLSSDPNFEETLVNFEHSAIHLPINVYEKSVSILNDFKWSEQLTQTFIENYLNDSSLSWQFFGSSKGFIRIYPATKWKVPHDALGQSKLPTPDLYDCRIRPWYIQSAASPKDMVILLDVSGSMTGLRKTIALNVVHNILDTLTEDDFVIVLKFTNDIKFVSPCIDRLVQANRRNLREIKEKIEILKTFEVANFTSALIQAFTMLSNFTGEHRGAQCNQAIMMITDGAPEKFEPVFQKYNPDSLVRLFTYVIGREVTQIHEVYWMACNNRGYYAQVSNLAEVREQVQQYIPVMSRPIVLNGERIFSWTPVYAHIAEIQLTDWIWEERVKALKTRLLLQNRAMSEDEIFENMDSVTEADISPPLNQYVNNIELEMAKRWDRKKKIQLMTTLSTQVFDHRKYFNLTKKLLIKNVYTDSEPELIRIAELQGVAGVDVPIREFEKMASPFKLGVNGYSFMLTNNGKIVYHPDFRPVFQDMLKPFYDSVDMTEIELTMNSIQPRYVDPDIQTIRSAMLNGSQGSQKLIGKLHFDQMKRPMTILQDYIYGKIDETPFSFAIVLPEQYGSYRFVAQIDLKSENYSRYFLEPNWNVHPDWVYCNVQKHALLDLPEDIIKYVLESNNFIWKESGVHQPHIVTCDKELLQSLVYDAVATHSFNDCHKSDNNNSNVVNVLISTRSGLTRFKLSQKDDSIENKNDRVYRSLVRSIDEVYYRRAVDFYYKDNSAFVYSVPFDAAIKESEFFITASRAIFAGNRKMTAPVAVIAAHYNYSFFNSAFFMTAERNQLECSSDNITCFVMDNNGFVIISEDYSQVGKFFGEIDDDLLQHMVSEGIYQKVHYYDYQAICFDIINTSSSSAIFMSPLNYIKQVLWWLGSKLTYLYLNLFYNSWMVSLENMEDMEVEYETDMYDQRFNKSRPKPCDREFDLYKLSNINKTYELKLDCQINDCIRDYYVQKIPHSNLIILAIFKICSCTAYESTAKMEMKEIVYNLKENCKYFFQSEPHRKRPESCNKQHSEESKIKLCGGTAKLVPNIIWSLLVTLIAHTFVIYSN